MPEERAEGRCVMPLKKLSDVERTCKNCRHDDADVDTCGSCDRGWSGGEISAPRVDNWVEAGWSVRKRADERVAELEAAITAYLEEGGCEHPAKCIEDGVEIIACAERGLCEALYGKGGA